MTVPRVSTAQLAQWAQHPSAADCGCRSAAPAAWASINESQWPPSLQKIATLRDEGLDEPTFTEYLPAGVRYDAPQAPVAPAYFPYNRCDVYRCSACGGHVLRYTEFGGYYVDHRVRGLQGLEVVDVPVGDR